jgi:hypothetical protein
VRERLVSLNTAALATIVPVGLDKARNRLERAQGLSKTVTLELFPGLSVTAERTDIEAPDEGGYVWAGKANGDQASFVTLVIHNNSIVGEIQTEGRVYSVEQVSGGLHRIVELDQSKQLNDLHIPTLPGRFPNKSETTQPLGEPAELTTVTTIRVLVANTYNARNECLVGGTVAQDQQCMQQRITLAISKANQAFNNSGVLIKYVRVGGPTEVSYADTSVYGANTSNNYTGVLCDLSGFINCFSTGNNKTGTFAAIRTKRDNFAADLVVLMRKMGAACGVAWVPDPPTASTANQGFSVVTSTKGGVYNCIEGNTLAHETGHNLGLHHDRYVEPPAPISKFNYGYVDTAPTGRFREIMSYPNKCNALSIMCTRIPYFSTPLKLYNGRKVGIAANHAGAADGARTLNVTRAIVGAYR